MSDVLVRTVNLTKAYTLYPSHGDRLADLIGWSRLRHKTYPTHLAVDNVSLEIGAGEKVAFIGRNGAGKSTLLKLITGVTEPTSGELEVTGKSHALLQMGAGFHQEFTGRQNAYAYLANLGVVGESADRLVDEIVEFTELEEYIDQPLKTYSTGMSMRLIFAASTTVAPSLFVIDEVLGVGDAYFQGKSFARLEELCGKGTTLLLVSHDIYNAAKICNRMIWLERGRVMFDGDARTALNLYENSIKEQEEQRLRRKALMCAKTQNGAGASSVLVELRPKEGSQLAGHVLVREASVWDGDLDLSGRRGEQAQEKLISIVHEGSSWVGDATVGSGELTIANYGSPFHKGILRVRTAGADNARLKLVIESPVAQELEAVVYDRKDQSYAAGDIQLASATPTEWVLPLTISSLPQLEAFAPTERRHGSGDVRIAEVDVLDADLRSTRSLETGQPTTFRLRCEVRSSSPLDEVEIMFAFFKDGVQDVMRVFGSPVVIPRGAREITVDMRLRKLPLCAGEYAITVLVAKYGYYRTASGKPFSLNRDVYDAVARQTEFKVATPQVEFVGTILVGDADWTIAEVTPEARRRDDVPAHETGEFRKA